MPIAPTAGAAGPAGGGLTALLLSAAGSSYVRFHPTGQGPGSETGHGGVSTQSAPPGAWERVVIRAEGAGFGGGADPGAVVVSVASAAHGTFLAATGGHDGAAAVGVRHNGPSERWVLVPVSHVTDSPV